MRSRCAIISGTGAGVAHSIDADAGELLGRLLAETPAFLLTHPSLIRELARLPLERGVRLDGLVEVRSFAEMLGGHPLGLQGCPGAPVTDVRSAVETGDLALQCPGSRTLSRAGGRRAARSARRRGTRAPGKIGRVVITTLHNFAMPLIRYHIGDYAEVGQPCTCGRGLPVLTSILGRVRNTLITADGKSY